MIIKVSLFVTICLVSAGSRFLAPDAICHAQGLNCMHGIRKISISIIAVQCGADAIFV